MRLSPTQVVFMTTGSGSCPWWPKRLIVLSHTAIRIDMRIRNRGTACMADLVGFPIAVKIDPQIVDVQRPLTVRLAYKVHYCCDEGTRQWHRTAVAPAIHRF